MAGRQDHLTALVERFVKAVNDHDVDRVLELVTDDAHVSFAGLTPFEGKDRVRAYFEWFAGYGASWQLDIVGCRGNSIRCRLAAHDGWSEAAGISPLMYSRVDISFKNGLVSMIETEFSPETNHELSQVLESFTPWAAERYPELYTEDGDYAYYRDTGARMVEAMQKWKELTPTD